MKQKCREQRGVALVSSEFVHANPFSHQVIVLDGTAIADEGAVLHMRTHTVRAPHSPTTTLAANLPNPWNLLHTACTYSRITCGQDRSRATGQAGGAGRAEQMVKMSG
ncbi:hypothetical protein HUB98_14220 [Paenibacillus barcinonensis]|uniref:Uncharacterized protein n=1 Tax=Paenibacillus barcinonensis TaxID=198119 RepID=A0ABX6Q570_PAEBA|nr:hypothetical protein [Paenibacillus barcinonensis]QKS57346.1 hypothetical protein HUB98_14220 [Paenibacillus barcinonensis]